MEFKLLWRRERERSYLIIYGVPSEPNSLKYSYNTIIAINLHEVRCGHENAAFALYEKPYLKTRVNKHKFYLQRMTHLQLMKMM